MERNYDLNIECDGGDLFYTQTNLNIYWKIKQKHNI